MSSKPLSRLQLINEFEAAPNAALFNQITLAAILNCSKQLLERNRWAGEGVPYIKIGRRVLYRKTDIINFLQKQKVYCSTSDAGTSLELANDLV